ncbi:alpha/beta fold hydrolase [Acidovorax sp. Leaf160]|uniref:alpha/beta fold hydrolase n=1 Tax=Acidovorax sp. Leaf160 TaxID=1736280 RepID=UPI0009EC1A06|nr:alpha/beta hydrolase [Acidovorax sp. Leaf160]
MATWILLRGLTREAGHWGSFLPEFHALVGAQCVVLALDLPGNGSLHRESSPWRVQDMLAACRAQVAQAGLKPPFHLLAMSLGAMVAAEWMQQSPEDIAACVLINTSVRGFSPFYRRLRGRNYGTLLTLACVWAQPARAEAVVHALTSRQAASASREDCVVEWVAIRSQRPVSRANALRQLVAAAVYRPSVAPPAVPVLLLASVGDRLVHWGCSAAIARAWDCALAVHPAAGHDLPLDAPQWVLSSVATWLRSLEADRASGALGRPASIGVNKGKPGVF